MGRKLVTYAPQTPIREVVTKMRDLKIGSVLIADEEQSLIGIFTERDVMMDCLEPDFLERPVSDFMTMGPATVQASDPMESVYRQFKDARFRHLPVLEGNRIAGMISMRDLIRYWTNLVEVQKKELMQKYEKTMSVIVHDLRSPIYAIKSINELLLGPGGSANEYMENQFPQMVDESCETMSHLIDDLLEIAEVNSGVVRLEFKEQNVESILKKVVKTFEPSAKAKHIEIETSYDKALPLIPIDQRRFVQIMHNLLSNAIKYSDKDSKVHVELGMYQDQAYISVRDHGQGIKEHELPHVFDEMCKISSTPTANEKSTGLGLSIVKKLVQAHGGEITVRSEPYKETEFRMTLPLELRENLCGAAAS